MNKIEKEIDIIIKYQNIQYEKNKNSFAIRSIIDLNKINIYNSDSKINNKLFAIKDNINIENHKTTLGSKLLEDFIAPKNATVVDILLKNGAIPIFKANLDELAMGGDGLKSAYGKIINPIDNTRIIGGSSSGSAYLVSQKIVNFALGSDTGDSVRKPASYVGIIGFKPSWGLVSRNGMSDFAPSWDTIGWFTNNVEFCAYLADLLIQKDEQDATSIEFKRDDKDYFYNNLNTNQKFKIAYSEQIIEWIKEEEIKEGYLRTIEELRKKGHIVEKIDLNIDLLKGFPIIYRIITSTEGLSSTYNLNGWLYGKNSELNKNKSYNEIINQNRGLFLGREVKKRLSIGTYYLENINEFIVAKKIRFLIKEELNKIYKNFDLIIYPSVIDYPPKIDSILEKSNEVESYDLENDYLGISNLTGRPSISIPLKTSNSKEKPIGISINGNVFEDLKVLQLAKIIEDIENEI